MQSSYLQIGSRLLNTDAIHYFDLQHPRETGGTCVRCWFGSGGVMPSFLDLSGVEAQLFRSYAAKLGDTGQIALVGRTQAAQQTAASPTAGSPTHRRNAKSRAQARAKSRAVGQQQTGETPAAAVETKPVARATASRAKPKAAHAGQPAA